MTSPKIKWLTGRISPTHFEVKSEIGSPYSKVCFGFRNVRLMHLRRKIFAE
ncbi:MAG: hypothetical protein NZ937_07755 [Armatimonadetes bacterium]|nr:hypothetical protein [Armatimonadota bacterium]